MKKDYVYVSKDDLRQLFILPLIDKVEKDWDKYGNDPDYPTIPFLDEVTICPELPTSKMFTWLNRLECSMCSSEPATEFEIQVCRLLPSMFEFFTDWDDCCIMFDQNK